MIVVQMARDMREHFAVRSSEWGLATMAALFGVILLQPGDTVGSSPAFRSMAELGTDSEWGAAALAIGVLRLIALFVNGTYRRSPYVRAGAAFLCVGLWTTISLGIASSETAAWSTGLAIYPVLALMDINNIYRAVRDAPL